MKKNSPTTPMIGNFTPTVWKSVYKKTNFNFLPPTFIEKLPNWGAKHNKILTTIKTHCT
mgnify:FL=1